MSKGFRLQRIADLIRNTLAEILLQQTEDKRFHQVTITRVSVSRDLNHAKIYISTMTDENVQEVVTALNHAAKYLRYHLAHGIKLRITPELKFYYDDSQAKGQRIVSLLNKVLRGKNDSK